MARAAAGPHGRSGPTTRKPRTLNRPSPYTPAFTDLAGDEATFLAEHFDRKPLLRRDCLGGRHAELLAFADLDRMLSTETIRPPYIGVFRDGETVHEHAYTRVAQVQGSLLSDTVDPVKVVRQLHAGATVTWNSLNHFRPNLRALAADLAARFAARIDIMAFLAPPTIQGFRPHADAVDLFVIQLAGTKHWRVWEPTRPHRADAVEYHSADELGPPSLEMSMRPGDVLYMPYGTPHAVVAEDTVSLHISVMIRPRLWSDLLNRAVQQVLRADPEFSRFPYLNQENTPILAEELTRQITRLTQRLSELDASEAVVAALRWPGAGEGARTPTLLSDYIHELEQHEPPR